MSHHRSVDFETVQYSEDCPKCVPLKMIIFSDDVQFRSHALGHLTRIAEIESGWKKIFPKMNEADILATLDKLKKLGCAWNSTSIVQHRPFCKACRLYERCTPIVEYVEVCYLEAVKICVQKSLEYPRFACYADNTQENYFLDGGPQMHMFFGSVYENQKKRYLLQTCYAETDPVCFQELVELQKNKIRLKANKYFLNWCTSESWNDGPTEIEDNSDKRKNTPFRKNSRKNFRYHLSR